MQCQMVSQEALWSFRPLAGHFIFGKLLVGVENMFVQQIVESGLLKYFLMTLQFIQYDSHLKPNNM